MLSVTMVISRIFDGNNGKRGDHKLSKIRYNEDAAHVGPKRKYHFYVRNIIMLAKKQLNIS